MLRVHTFFVVVVIALLMTSCAADTETQTTPDRVGVESYRDLSGDEPEEPWQATSAPFAVPPTDTETTPDRPGAGRRGPSGDEMKETGPLWKGRFTLKELMPKVDPELVRAKQIYMCADPRIHRSQMEPSSEGGITKTRVAVRSEKEDSEWLILIDQEPAYRMFQVIRWLEIVRALSWAGAEHILLGSVSFGGFTFESDPSFPLHFKLVQDVGYVHLCGRGTVTTPKGRKYSLEQVTEIGDFVRDLSAEDQLARETAAEALGWLAKTESEIDKAVPALVDALKDDAMEVRRNAAASLGKIGDLRAREGLREALQDEDEWVREVVADALKKVGGMSSVHRLTSFISARCRIIAPDSEDGLSESMPYKRVQNSGTRYHNGIPEPDLSLRGFVSPE